MIYDQSNIVGLACFESAARRFQLIIAAHSTDALNPVYAGTEFYGGAQDGDELIAPNLKRKVLEGTKGKSKVLKAETRAREFKNTLSRPEKPKKGEGKGDKGG